MVDYNSSYTGAQIDANLAKAATAVQPAGLATVATTGAYGDLSGKPTLGTAAATASTDYATAAQGTLAATAVQPGDDAADLGSGAATDGYVLTADGAGGAAWEAASGGGGTPGGADTQVQFNDGGAFGGDSGFTFDKTNNTLGLGGGTITASDPIIDMAQTWNNGAVAFTAIKANVTDTASAAGSLLMDLQVGGVEEFQVVKDGQVLSGRTATSSPTYSFIGDPDTGWGYRAANTLTAIVGGSEGLRISSTSVDALTGTIGASLGGRLGLGTAGSFDIFLNRDAANTLAQRNGVNAQAFNLYNTYTDASNYERGVMKWDANTLRIGVEAAGTGTNRTIEFRNTGTRFVRVPTAGGIQFFNGANRELYLQWDAVGVRSDAAFLWSSSTAIGEGAGDTGFVRAAANIVRVTNGSTGGGAMQLTEMTTPAAPATNNVRIYAEDDGTGKTRLMALFPTGAAQQIAIEP